MLKMLAPAAALVPLINVVALRLGPSLPQPPTSHPTRKNAQEPDDGLAFPSFTLPSLPSQHMQHTHRHSRHAVLGMFKALRLRALQHAASRPIPLLVCCLLVLRSARASHPPPHTSHTRHRRRCHALTTKRHAQCRQHKHAREEKEGLLLISRGSKSAVAAQR